MSAAPLLVVDDDRGNCAILSRRLTRLGYRVDVAYDGPSALKMLKDQPYRVAVLDYKMPGMNGVEVYEQARQLQPNLVGVFLTAFAGLDSVFPAGEAGVERVLSKPVDFGELLPILERFAGKPTPPAA
jgi:two-component system, NtrC family, response regulator HydG